MWTHLEKSAAGGELNVNLAQVAGWAYGRPHRRLVFADAALRKSVIYSPSEQSHADQDQDAHHHDQDLESLHAARPSSMTFASTYTVKVTADKAGGRLDRVLAEALPEISRTRLKALIEDGRVEMLGHRVADPATRVREGESFIVTVPATPPLAPRPQVMPLSIAHEDEHLIVIDKPAGLVVHAGAGNPDGTLVNALVAHCPLSSIGAPLRPGIVHRLDKDTSGLLVVAKTDAAHVALARQFAEHSVGRAYQALVWGNPIPAVGRISTAIGRSSQDRTRMAVVSRGGKAAVTDYKTIRIFGSVASLVECRLTTGRTHQIRVHMASIRNPIVGDAVYGGRRPLAPSQGRGIEPSSEMPAQALHAHLIGFTHPASGQRLRIESPLPQHYKSLIDFLEQI
jgi:23S rRNA pseudouridine1911/1915/1917 synthase